MERYLGLDVHRDSTSVVVLNARGKRVRRDVVETNGQALVGYLRSLGGSLHLCLEESEWSQWLTEILSPAAQRVVVYRAQWRAGPKNDEVDAADLAERLRTGRTGCPVFKAPGRWSELRETVRAYTKLTQDVVRAKQRLKSLFRRRGVPAPSAEIYDSSRREGWVAKLPVGLHTAAELFGAELDGLERLQAEAQRAMLAVARRFKVTRVLHTAPGIGPKRAAVLLAVVVTPHRFRTKRQFWSYCGLGVVTRTSSDWVQANGRWQRVPVQKTRGLNRSCNRPLKALFKAAAITVVSHSRPNPLRDHYDRLLAAGTKPNLAKLTIARSIAAIVLAMWKTQTEYRPMS
jgi:transposase